jgi:hypothetical protein
VDLAATDQTISVAMMSICKSHLTTSTKISPSDLSCFTTISFVGIDEPNWAANTAKQIEANVKAGAKGLKIYKSLGLSVKDKNGKRVQIDDPRIDPVWAKCGELGIPVLIMLPTQNNSGIPSTKTMNDGWS